MIKAEIITIGDEILYGQITDTNTQWISAELDKIGIRTIRKSSVGDSEEAILGIFEESSKRVDLVIITGGLGPTKDDITKKTFCKYFNTELIIHPRALADVTEFFKKRGRELSDLNKGQGEIPANATFIPNTMGTAPGMWFEENNVVYISMPGVPFEMKGMMSLTILPKLKEHFKTPIIFHKVIRTVGIGESYLAEMIENWENTLPENIKLAYLPAMGNVKLRLTGFGEDLRVVENQVEEQFYKVLPTIHEYVYGFGKDELEEVIGRVLTERKETISVAESCTGGYLAHQFTKVSGSSAYFMGGIVSYDNEIKINQLDVKSETLQNHGAVSEQTVTEMSENVRKLMKTTYGLATSGVAGPNGGTPEKPVGTIWIAISSEKETITKQLTLGGSREQNIHLTAINILNLLRIKCL
ncbi:MAG: competence/damage-inducible protein A [Arcicella sp.]|nr:competence/damage-inducible protein A [Arcicella sp.]